MPSVDYSLDEQLDRIIALLRADTDLKTLMGGSELIQIEFGHPPEGKRFLMGNWHVWVDFGSWEGPIVSANRWEHRIEWIIGIRRRFTPDQDTSEREILKTLEDVDRIIRDNPDLGGASPVDAQRGSTARKELITVGDYAYAELTYTFGTRLRTRL